MDIYHNFQALSFISFLGLQGFFLFARLWAPLPETTLTKESFIHGGAEIALAFAAVSVGLYGALLLQFLPWAEIGEALVAIART
jgi:O-antigen ligase